MNLKGKVALVTGGAVRIGAAICRALAAEGTRVVIHYRRSKKEALALAREEENVAKLLAGKTVVKEIWVPGKLVNFAVKG